MEKIKVLFICHGNICRSTLAESVFTHKVNSLGLAHNFEIDSFATSREEIGNPPHYGTVNKLREEHIPLVPHHKQISKIGERTIISSVCDNANIQQSNRMLKNDPDEKVINFFSLNSAARRWILQGGDFEATYRDECGGCNGFRYTCAEGKNLKIKRKTRASA